MSGQQQGEARSELQYTTHVHLLTAAHAAGVMLRREDITSTEHKVNGKTKGSVGLTWQRAKANFQNRLHSLSFDRQGDQAVRMVPSQVSQSLFAEGGIDHSNFQGKTITPQFVASNAAQTHKIPTGRSTRFFWFTANARATVIAR